MEETVDWPLISTHFLDASSHIDSLGNGGLLSELTSTSELKNETEARTEANDVLKNGILIETGKGLQWLSLTEALTSGVGGLNLSVEDFQNVAAQLLHSQTSVGAGTIENSLTPSVEEEQISLIPNPKLESIAEATEQSEVELFQPVLISNISVSSKNLLAKKIKILTSSESSSLTVSESTGTNSDSSVQSAPPIQVKRKGGWPKGRKRKPELTNRPPKAPCTGYVYYLNEKRKRPEFSNMPFPVVTKVIGNEWSSLSLERKKEYLEKAEMDKKRYREELKVYRNSDTYRSHLKRRRIKNCKTNGTEESDVDATDEIDDEDNEELYCRACDQWFTTLHNKKEHLYGKQHFQTIYQNANSSLSLDESSLDGVPLSSLGSIPNPELPSVPDAMSHLFCNIAEREREINTLQEQLQSSVVRNKLILKELHELKQSQVKLQKLFSRQKDEQCKIERVVGNLWSVSEYFNLQ